MKHLVITIMVLACVATHAVFSSGAAEAAGGAGQRTQYLAERGMIVPPDEIHINSYIAAVDYRYPLPESDMDVYLYNGNRQLSVQGREGVLQIGIQAAKVPFEELTPMNLSFVIDRSGSMNERDKLTWVKDAFDIFINQVRDVDFVSLVIFNNDSEVIFPATRMDSRRRRRNFQKVVQSVVAEGGTNIRGGLELGCLEVLKNLNAEYTNRVMFLSDGQDTAGNSHESILEVARGFADLGVTISSIGLGESFDLELMVNIAKVGEGSSRFISDHQEMAETFGSELDRMVVPQAKNMEMTLEFLVDVEVLDTWWYQNRRAGNTVRYFQPTLHHGDYETILVQYRTKPQHFTGTMDLARFSIVYEDIYGNPRIFGPRVLQATFVDDPQPVVGISDGMVLRSGTMLHLAKNLTQIGETFYTDKTPAGLEKALSLTIESKKELVNTKMRLDDEGFEDEINILDRYIEILGRELALSDERTDELAADVSIAPPTPERSFSDHVRNLCLELSLSLRPAQSEVVALFDFSTKGSSFPDLTTQLSQMAHRQVSAIASINMVPVSDLNTALGSAGYSLEDLNDKLTAIEVGRNLNADYVVTGTVVPLSDSMIIFSRVLNIKREQVESTAQIIIPWS